MPSPPRGFRPKSNYPNPQPGRVFGYHLACCQFVSFEIHDTHNSKSVAISAHFHTFMDFGMFYSSEDSQETFEIVEYICVFRSQCVFGRRRAPFFLALGAQGAHRVCTYWRHNERIQRPSKPSFAETPICCFGQKYHGVPPLS